LIEDKSNDLQEVDFVGLQYSDKIMMLIQYEASLVAKAEKENLSILRMKGVIQSYELFDSIKYNKAR
jgi:hypothetical protein